MKPHLILTILLVVAVAGCTGQNNSQAWKGDPNQGEIGSPQLIEIGDKELPSSVSLGQEFPLYFAVKNVGTDLNTDRVSNLDVQITDTGLCSFVDRTEAVATLDDMSDSISPGTSESVFLEMESPSIGTPIVDTISCPVRVRASYDFQAISVVDNIQIISQAEFQRSGYQLDEVPTINQGRGPLRIYLTFTENLPARAGRQVAFKLWVEDKGDGSYTSIPPETLTLTMPNDYTPDNPEENYVACDGFKEGDELNTFVNSEAIRFPPNKQQTNAIACFFDAPTDVSIRQTDIISATLDYTYIVDDTLKITVSK